ncbi:non-specific riboncleoside hydrolase [Keratinibaculum paraultunense]|uniref:Non-specific riboncleoside hydrolase n=1 Tax=Keratinibaculum paraultunense TaxID=1278232 RepID=A0A4V2UUP3_9FIRM|nr:ribonucleoside hydrolase RihC [Keratinibaculum paraultunense]TCS91730.1 non-specific riboncleoside hydrolase [Keratinibaculum paraultunense]
MDTLNKRKLIIDTDPGIDDVVAIAIALFDETLDVELITTVAGNVDVERTTNNALKLVEFLGRDVPVAKGARKPLMVDLENASEIHGKSGLDGYEFKEPSRKPLEDKAIVAMKNVIMESDSAITLMAIGPLTNIALLLSVYPEVKKNIQEIVFMGGSTTRGNKTPMGEFNMVTDPEAADIVFKSGLPIVMCGLDLGEKVLIYLEDSEKIRKLNKTGEMIYSLFKHYRGGSFYKGLKIYDSFAIAYILKPEMFETKDCYVAIETFSSLTRGCTVVDLNNCWRKEPNVKVCLNVNESEFKKWLIEAIAKCI